MSADASTAIPVTGSSPDPVPFRRDRPRRACTSRSALLRPDSPPSPPPPASYSGRDSPLQCGGGGGGGGGGGSRVTTPLAPPEPPPGQEPRWALRSMGELAAVLNFLNVILLMGPRLIAVSFDFVSRLSLWVLHCL